MRILVTGSSGLIGSSAVEHFDRAGHDVTGVDNNMRSAFLGPAGDTTQNLARLKASCHRFSHHALDIRDRLAMTELVAARRFDAVIHCAAQPSHDRATEIPVDDFEVNALGTLHLLEAVRQHAPEAAFVHMSTNKVYGDAPNELDLVELATRWEYADPAQHAGIDETMRIDQSLHSLFGASKAAADVVAQEYGRYFGMNVGVFRGGCLTGPRQAGVEQHGFLSHLAKVAARGGTYCVFGYKGKQVRDQIHSEDVVSALAHFIADPRPGEVYNIGGERRSSASILECFDLIAEHLGRPVRWDYVNEPRRGDHICYITDMAKFRSHYPGWSPQHSLDDIIGQLLVAEAG
jgi:CDP-paratose 2-epimerase